MILIKGTNIATKLKEIYGEEIGSNTNNEAEYEALIKGLELCKAFSPIMEGTN